MTFNFGSGGATNFGAAAKPAWGNNSFSFGSATTSATTGTFGAFGNTPTTTNTSFGGFGATPAATAAPTFGGFGAAATMANTGFGGFSAPATSTGATAFGFGAATSAAPTFGGFGTPASTTTTNTLFPSFGANTNTGFGGTGNVFGTPAPNFGASGIGIGSNPTFGAGGTFGNPGTFGATAGGFGSAFPNFGSNLGTNFGAKPAGVNTTNFSGFGATLGGTSAFGQPQQVQQPQAVNPNEALMNAVFNCNIFGDERDQILAKYNFLQAKWGFGKAYYSNSHPPIELTEQNPLCRFKAIGYNCFLSSCDKDGLVQLLFNRSEQDIKSQQQQLQTSLTTLLGNKPTLTISIDSIKPVSEAKSQVIIYVMEKSATGGTGSRIPATELSQFLNGTMQRQQLTCVGVLSVLPHARPEPRYLQEYLDTPPPGIDIRLWKQAQADNPDPEKYFPTPMIGFSEVKWRMRCQEEETQVHAAFLSKTADEIREFHAKLAAANATLQEQRRRFVHLHHRLLTVVVRQESARKAGTAITPEEEALRGRLEALHSQLSAPTKFNGRLSELLSQMRMQRSQATSQKLERYSMDEGSQDDIKQFLSMQHKGMTHLIETVNTDMEHLKCIHEGMNKIVQEAEY